MTTNNLAQTKWQQGQLLAFSALDGKTDYQFGLAARTVLNPPGLELMDPAKGRIAFEEAPIGSIVFGGDYFTFATKQGSLRGLFLDAYHILIEGMVSFSGDDSKITHQSKGYKHLIGVSGFFNPSLLEVDLETQLLERGAWFRNISFPPGLSRTSHQTLGRALTFMKGQVCSPEGKLQHRWTTPDRWPHKDMWLWDTGFHAIGWRHVDPNLAMEMIDAMFDLQREDGFLTYRGNPGGPYHHLGDLVTQPPILTHAVQLVNEKSNNPEWLAKIYPKLSAYVRWDLEHRDTDGGGLVEWFIEDDETCRSGESGMDNSPRFDTARRLDAVDFNAFLARECEALSEMANKLGRADEAKSWKDQHVRLCALINSQCWCEEEGFYFDYDPKAGERTQVWASAGFLPLFCGAASQEQAEQLATHLRDPERFATATPIPSVAVCDRVSYSKDMWRGPMWVNLNWLIDEGFERYGMFAEAAHIREATRLEIERCCEKFGVFFEYYDDRKEVEPPDLLRKGINAPELNPYRQVIHDFGWTATLYVDLVHRAQG